jgi:hypothetical protein
VTSCRCLFVISFHCAASPNDKETLLNKANLYLIRKISQKKTNLYSYCQNDPIVALNGLSLIEHIDGKDGQKALAPIPEAIEKNSTDESLKKQTQNVMFKR